MTAGPDSEDGQQRLLRRNRRLATGLLLAAAAAYLALTLWPGPSGFWRAFATAAAEASIIGALADWFAVTALFRRPLGLPIPHTAILPTRKDRIGEGFGTFVERNFLDPELVAGRVARADPAARLAAWLMRDGAAEHVAARVAGSLPPVLAGLESPRLRGLFAQTVGEQLGGAVSAPLLGRALKLVMQGGHHAPVIARLSSAGLAYIDEHQSEIEAMVEERTAWWMPRTIDRRMARAIGDGIRDLLVDLAQPGTAARKRLEAALAQLTSDLETRPETIEAVERAKRRILNEPEAQAALGGLWDALRRAVETDLGRAEPRTTEALAAALQALGDALERDESARRLVNDAATRLAAALARPWRASIGRFISDVVRSWDAKTVTRRLELALGPDLQYVRISGTVVAALIGSALFLLRTALEGGLP